MSNDLVAFFGQAPVSPRDPALQEALKALAAAKTAYNGALLLRLTKAGGWVFGPDNEPLESGTRLVVNPATISAGYIAWHQGQVEDERMQPIIQGPIDARTLPPVKSKNGWQSQVAVDLVTEDEPRMKLVYKTNSTGGMRAVLNLAAEISAGMQANKTRAFPVVALETGSYIHKEYGEIFYPIFKIVGWLDENGNHCKPQMSLI